MPKKERKGFLARFLSNDKAYPVLAGLAAGLYPVAFYYTHNYPLINSWKHLGFFICLFLIVPAVGFWIIHRLFGRKRFTRYRSYVLPFLNVFSFLFFIQLCLYASIQWLFLPVLLIVALLFARYGYRVFKKVMVLQFLLFFIALFWLVPTISKQLSYSDAWLEQPDDIASASFVKKPNVYYIQPDGYVNFSEMDKGYYKHDNSEFKTFLLDQGFKIYPDIRSNYSSTLVSNSANFAMKHHFYNNGFNFSEIANAREVIISDNPVLNAFKKNGYKTHFFPEISYILTNFPEMGYDVCNFDYGEMGYLSEGLSGEKDVYPWVEEYMQKDPETPKFFFVEIFKPGHVESQKNKTKGKAAEEALYFENLKLANEKLKKLVTLIREGDPGAIIMIMADHGGYVGYEYMLELREHTMDRDKLYSAFSTLLAIHWPDEEAPAIDTKFNSTVNVFRILFSYLSETNSYLDQLQDEGSYTIIEGGAPKGIYKVIDESGNVTFEKQ